MATSNEKVDTKAPEKKDQPVQKLEKAAESPKPQAPEKIKFLVWFVGAQTRFNGIQAHHMTTIRTYFRDIGLGEPETQEDYDQGLIKFGFGRKK
jgi:hypothetical protein